jgi:hypothetical protein
MGVGVIALCWFRWDAVNMMGVLDTSPFVALGGDVALSSLVCGGDRNRIFDLKRVNKLGHTDC